MFIGVMVLQLVTVPAARRCVPFTALLSLSVFMSFAEERRSNEGESE